MTIATVRETRKPKVIHGYTAKKMRSPLKYHGGKSYLARRIIDCFPEHKNYVELFAGGCSVLLNKKRTGGLEFANDADADLIHFWNRLKNDPGFAASASFPYTREIFEHSLPGNGRGVPLMSDAVRYFVRNRMSRGGLGKDFAWSDRKRGGQPGDVNAWMTALAEIPLVRRRIEDVAFVHMDWRFLLCIAILDAQTLVYADPPYLHETRVTKKAYQVEMASALRNEETRAELFEMLVRLLGPSAKIHPERDNRLHHLELLLALKALPGPVAISGYRSTLYDVVLEGWTRHEFNIANHSGQNKKKQRRIECLWVRGAA